MKKQENKKKGLKWILLALLLLVVAVTAVILIVVLTPEDAPAETVPPTETTQPTAVEPVSDNKIYWNVERSRYVAKGLNGASGRSRRSDDYYYVRFAVDGEQVDIPVESSALLERIDMMDYMGIVQDEDGVIVDVLDIYEFTGGLAADHYYVQSVDGTKVTVNTSGTYRGVSVELDIPETAEIYMVGCDDPLVGLPASVSEDDEVIAIKDDEGQIFLVYVIPYSPPGAIYWNLNRQYDSASAATTRQPDASGYYVFELAYGGGTVTYKTRELSIASEVDRSAAKCMGLVVDEDGIITGVLGTGNVTGGSAFASWYHIDEVGVDSITATKHQTGHSEDGITVTGYTSQYTKIVNVSGKGDLGEYLELSELRAGDQIHCLTDSRGRLAYVFVISRLSETAKLVWNVERKYDSTNKVTTRTPNNEGYYEFTLAWEGEHIQARTKDVEIATKMDSYASKCFAVELEGDIITSMGGTAIVTGGSVVASWYDVIEISEDGQYVTAKKAADSTASDAGKVVTVTLDSDTDIFDVSGNGEYVGVRTEAPLVGDRIHCLTNLKGTVHTMFVVNRLVDVPLGWNLTRMYDTVNKCTTRERAADGYFYFDICINGQKRTLKTADIDVANMIDSTAAKVRGLKLQGDVIVKAYAASSVRNTNGTVEVSWAYVTAVGNGVAYAEKRDGTQAGETYTITLAKNCKIYNISGAYVNNQGEATNLQVGDLVHCLKNTDGETTYIFVISRVMAGKVGWNVTRKWNSTEKTTTRTPDADGWYYITMAIDGQQVELKTQDIEHVNAIDGNAAMCRGLVLDGNVIKRVLSPSSIKGTNGGVNGSWVTVTEVTKDGCKAVKISSGDDNGQTFDIPFADDCKIYNVSGVVRSHVGEETTVKPGAVIHVLVNSDKEATIVYVITEGVDNASQGYCNVCKKTVLWAPWNGKNAMVGGIHYYLEEDIHMDTYTTVSAANTTLFLNGHTVTSDSRVFKLTGGSTLTIYDSKADGSDIGGKIIGKGLSEEEAQAEQNGTSEAGVIMLWGTNTLNLYSGTLTYVAGEKAVSNGGVVGGNGTFNMYGGTVSGGIAANSGGNIRMFNGTFNMYGGTVSGGQAASGGNIAVGASRVGQINIYGGTVKDGQATHGGNICYSGGASGTISGGTVTGGYANLMLDGTTNGNGGNILINANASVTITGGTIVNGYGRRGGNIAVFGDAEISGVTLSGSDAYYSATELFTYGAGNLTLTDVTLVANAESTVRTLEHYGATLTLGGKVIIPSVYLSNNKPITVSDKGLDNSSSITVRTGTNWAFATVPETADRNCFISEISDYDVAISGKELYLKAQHEHCVCNGGTDAHTHSVEGWSKWDGTTAMTAGTNYYLTQDVTIDQWIELNGSTTSVCLNGYSIISSTRAFKLKGGATLNISDCVGNGQIVGRGITADEATAEQKGTSEAGVIMLWGSNTLNLFGGTVRYEQGAYAVLRGGVVGGNGTFNMYGGTVSGGVATSDGGNVRMFNGVFNMYGGTVSAGTANRGTSVQADGASGKINIVGGTVEGSAYVASSAEISVGGTAKIAQVYLVNAEMLTVSKPLTGDAQIGIAMASPGVFMENVETDLSGYFTSDGAQVKYDADAKTLSLYIPPHSHCVCGAHTAGVGDHSTCDEVIWTAWTATDSLPTTSGHYYLTGNVTVGTVRTTVDSDISLCLNGYDVTTTGGLWLYGDLAITDCSEEADWGHLYANRTGHSAAIYTYELCNLRLYAGIIDGSKNTGTNASVVTLCTDDRNGDNVREISRFYMYGGKLVGRNANTASTGGIWLMLGCEFYMYDGIITGATGTKGSAISAENTNSKVFLYGGTITGNSGDKGAVYVAGKGNLTVSGTAKVTGNTTADGTAESNIYLPDVNCLNITDLDSTAQFGISAATKGVFAKNVETDLSGQFVSDDSTYKTVYDADAKTLSLVSTVPTHTHCLCAGNTVGGHATCGDVTWTAWTATDSLPTASGNYYLTDHVTLSTWVNLNGSNMDGDKTLNLCLNGYTVTSESRVFKLLNSAKLAVTDCGEGGELVGKGISDAEITAENNGGVSEGGVIMQWNSNTTFSLYAGTLRLASADEGGRATIKKGGIFQGCGVLNLYGGTMKDGSAYATGGAISLFGANARLNMYGGTVENCTAADGSAVTANRSGTGTLPVMSFTGGAVKGTVWVNANSELALGGTAQITSVYLPSGKTVSVAANLTSGAQISITMASPGKFAENVTTDVSAWFTSGNEGYGVVYDASAKTLSLVEGAVGHVHCLCGGSYDGDGHTHDASVEWIAWDGTVSTLESGKYYYLTQSVTSTESIQPDAGETFNICLNGFTFTTSNRALRIFGDLNITDCSAAGSGEIVSTRNVLAPVFYVQSGAEFNLYGGTLRSTNTSVISQAGIGAISDENASNLHETPGVMNMYGGKIQGRQVSGDGGAISVWNSATLNIYGGTIADGVAGGSGGNIKLGAGCTLNIYGGTVENGNATAYGGNICIAGNTNTGVVGNLLMTDGTVSGGEAAAGGNICLHVATGTVSGGLVTGGTATSSSGGNIHVIGNTTNGIGSTLTVNGTARIENGDAFAKGGNIYMQWVCKLYLGGEAVITGGKAGTSGGGITCFVCKPTISGKVQVIGNEGSDLMLDGNAATDTTAASNATIILEGLESGAKIGVMMTTPGTFASNVTTDISGYFQSNDSDYEIVWENNALVLKEKQSA